MATRQTDLPLVFVIGDSISMQYGPYLESALAGSYRYFRKSNDDKEKSVNLDIPEGANGGDSSRVLGYLKEWLAHGGLKPDVLLLNCGLHDIKTHSETKKIQVPLDLYKSNLREIINVSRQMGVRLVWMRTTHCVDAIHNRRLDFLRFSADQEIYNAAADEIMADAGIPVIDLHRFTRSLGRDEDLFCDHVHFHEFVRQRQGAFLAGWLIGWNLGRAV